KPMRPSHSTRSRKFICRSFGRYPSAVNSFLAGKCATEPGTNSRETVGTPIQSHQWPKKRNCHSVRSERERRRKASSLGGRGFSPGVTLQKLLGFSPWGKSLQCSES